jgi:hypothetical protein
MSKLQATKVPHSWDIENWPPDVYPNRSSRGRYLVRCHRDELMAAGAVTRIGRDLVVLGAAYAGWLQRNSSRVSGYEIAPNRDRQVAQDSAPSTPAGFAEQP